VRALEGCTATKEDLEAYMLPIPESKNPVLNDFLQKIGHGDHKMRWSHANGNIEDIRNHPFLIEYDDYIYYEDSEMELKSIKTSLFSTLGVGH
jgi:hypothetical protein